jgi:transcriptional regulator with XRE-family HTH domain
MNLVDFGKLVQALRKEHELTQKELATKMISMMTEIETELETAEEIISRIERGKRKCYEADELLALAKALNLTTGERKEFFAAASGVRNVNVVSPYHNPNDVLTHCQNLISGIHTSAYIIDQYLDIIAVNRPALYLYGLRDYHKWERKWEIDKYPTNMLDFFFDSQSPLRGRFALGDQKRAERFVRRQIMAFRERTLQYRARPYFKKLLDRLKKEHEKTFKDLWETAHHSTDADGFQEYITSLKDPKGNILRFITTTVSFRTEPGQLEVIVNSPFDEYTQEEFVKLLKTSGTGMIETWSRWPAK